MLAGAGLKVDFGLDDVIQTHLIVAGFGASLFA